MGKINDNKRTNERTDAQLHNMTIIISYIVYSRIEKSHH